jgi:hypothetical protein
VQRGIWVPTQHLLWDYCENHTEHTDTVRTSQETHYVSATEPNRLIRFTEEITEQCEINTEHVSTAYRRNSKFQNTEASNTSTFYNRCFERLN